MAYFGLYALQHRGQESTGIASYDGKHIRLHAGMGLVPDVYDEATLGQELQGNRAIGHVRYSTSGVSVRKNAQPLVVRVCGIEIALAHNGNLTNASELRGELESDGAIFQTSSDSEIFVHLIARSLAKKKDLEEAILSACDRVRGAYSLIILSEGRIIALRDAHGFHPLAMGKVDDAYVFGDSGNDLAMFRYASNCILMGKHDEVLEPYATFETKDVEEDGIAYAMKELGII